MWSSESKGTEEREEVKLVELMKEEDVFLGERVLEWREKGYVYLMKKKCTV